MLATPPLRRRTTVTVSALLCAVAAFLATGCGQGTADRGVVAKNLGLAYAAYTQYVSAPVNSGRLRPTTPKTDPASARAVTAAKYAVLALEVAREEAARENDLASFAQKVAAAAASLNAVSTALRTERPTRALVSGGQASLESLLAAARDATFKVPTTSVSAEQLSKPPRA